MMERGALIDYVVQPEPRLLWTGREPHFELREVWR